MDPGNVIRRANENPGSGGSWTDRELRQTGIRALGDMPWGSHFCVFHETQQDLLETLGPYFKAGLENNEFCVWIVPEPMTTNDAMDAVRQAVPDIDRHLAAENVELIPHGEWFFRGGSIDLQKTLDRFSEKCRRALSRGFAGMRLIGSPAWLEKTDVKQFCHFEKEIDDLIANERMIVLCSFPLSDSRASTMLDAARTHQFTLVRQNGVVEVIEPSQVPTGPHGLTPREVEVLGWVAQGKSAWEIAAILDIAKRTVDEHASSASRKLGAVNRAQAAAIAVRDRIISGRQP